MSLTTGVPGLPFQWSPNGLHQFAQVAMTPLVATASGERSFFEIKAPADRVVYIVSLFTQQNTHVFYYKSSSETAAATGGGELAIPDAVQFGGIDATSVIRTGSSSGSSPANATTPLVHLSTQTLPFTATMEQAISKYPLLVKPGEYFVVWANTANVILYPDIMWLERVVS